jgi:hypothetical protein
MAHVHYFYRIHNLSVQLFRKVIRTLHFYKNSLFTFFLQFFQTKQMNLFHLFMNVKLARR